MSLVCQDDGRRLPGGEVAWRPRCTRERHDPEQVPGPSSGAAGGSPQGPTRSEGNGSKQGPQEESLTKTHVVSI